MNISEWVITFIAFLLILSASLLFRSDFEESNKKAITNLTNAVKQEKENAFAEGQKKYFEGDISFDAYRNCWIKSPWDSKIKPITYVMCDNYKGK